jgi:amidase
MKRTAEQIASTIPSRESRDNEICYTPAHQLAAWIQLRKLSVREVMEVHLRRIARVNHKVNAIVTLVSEDKLMADARNADDAVAKGRSMGPLHGVPVGVKDLSETKGIRTTYGSPIFADFIPDRDAPVVKRMKSAGAIVVGKTNTSEFGMGSQTFNPVFGPTLNPYDTTRTCGGSTGGGAVALACGMVPAANGTDMGGSLRNPANFCNVVGFRPSPGLIPDRTPKRAGVFQLSVAGPIARTVADCALLLDVMAGARGVAGSDTKLKTRASLYGGPFFGRLARQTFEGVRVAMMSGLGLPWEPEVLKAFSTQKKVFESLGCIVEEAEPDLHDSNECFLALRHAALEIILRPNVDAHLDKVNAHGHWHVDEGRKQTRAYLAAIESKQRALHVRVREFFKKYDFFLLPVNQVLPFDVRRPYPIEIEGIKMENYVAWMKSTYYISVLGNPAISVPCAFSAGGLPIGIQIVGRLRDDLGVLQLSHAFEHATHVGKVRPELD